MAFEVFFNPEERQRTRTRPKKLTIIVVGSLLILLLIVIVVTLTVHRGHSPVPATNISPKSEQIEPERKNSSIVNISSSTETIPSEQIEPEPERTFSFQYHYNKTQSNYTNISCKIEGSEDECSDYMKTLGEIEEREFLHHTDYMLTYLEAFVSKWTININGSSLKSDFKSKSLSESKPGTGAEEAEEGTVGYNEEEFQVWDKADTLGTITFSETFSNSTKDEIDHFHCFETAMEAARRKLYMDCPTVEGLIKSHLLHEAILYMRTVMGTVRCNGTGSLGVKLPWIKIEAVLWCSTDGESISSNIEQFNQDEIAICNCHAANPMRGSNATISYQHCLDDLKISKEVQLRLGHLRCGGQAERSVTS